MASLKGDPVENLDLGDIGGSALDFATAQEKPIDQALGEYVMTARSQAKPLDIFNQLEQNAQLPQMRKAADSLRGQVYDLEDAIKGVKKNVAARSTQSIVTNAQQAGMVDADSAPLRENLGTIGTALGRVESAIDKAGSDIATKTGLVLQGNQMELDVFKTQMDAYADRAARLMTGFTTDQQNELTILLEKIHRQQSLTDQETQRAFELSKLEKQYELERNNFKYQQENSSSTQTVSLGNNKTALIDSKTGKVINTYGGSSSGGSGASSASKYLPSSSSSALNYLKYIS